MSQAVASSPIFCSFVFCPIVCVLCEIAYFFGHHFRGSPGSLKIDEALCDSCRVMSDMLKSRKPQLVQLLQTFIDSEFPELKRHLKELSNIVKNALGLVKELNASRSLQDILVSIVQSLLLPMLRMQLSLLEVPSFLAAVCGG